MGIFKPWACALTLCIAVVVHVQATTYTFTGAVSQSWSDPGNWTPSYPGTIISEGDVAVINANCNYALEKLLVNGGLQVNAEVGLTFVSGSSLANNGNTTIYGLLRVDGGAHMGSTALVMIGTGGTLSNGGTVIFDDGTVSNTGSVINDSGATLYNNPLANFTNSEEASLLNNGVLRNNGTMSAACPDFHNVTTIHNNGSLTITGVLTNTGDLHNGGVINLFGELIINNLSEGLNSGILDILPGGHCKVSGALDNFTNASLLVSGQLTTFATGELTNEGSFITYSMSVFVNDGGLIDNYGDFQNKGSFTNHGTFTSDDSVHNEALIHNHSIFTTMPGSTFLLGPESFFQNHPTGDVTIR